MILHSIWPSLFWPITESNCCLLFSICLGIGKRHVLEQTRESGVIIRLKRLLKKSFPPFPMNEQEDMSRRRFSAASLTESTCVESVNWMGGNSGRLTRRVNGGGARLIYLLSLTV